MVSHEDIPDNWRGQSEILLSGCLDYLSLRPDVDPARIAVYGEGLSAILATEFAASDRRISAAVCDAGLWNFARAMASMGWMSRIVDVVEEDVSVRRVGLVWRLRCPVLIVAGGRGIVSVSEATKLQAESAAAGVDLKLSVSRTTHIPVGEIENFVASDDSIFGWLEQKLSSAS